MQPKSPTPRPTHAPANPARPGRTKISALCAARVRWRHSAPHALILPLSDPTPQQKTPAMHTPSPHSHPFSFILFHHLSSSLGTHSPAPHDQSLPALHRHKEFMPALHWSSNQPTSPERSSFSEKLPRPSRSSPPSLFPLAATRLPGRTQRFRVQTLPHLPPRVCRAAPRTAERRLIPTGPADAWRIQGVRGK